MEPDVERALGSAPPASLTNLRNEKQSTPYQYNSNNNTTSSAQSENPAAMNGQQPSISNSHLSDASTDVPTPETLAPSKDSTVQDRGQISKLKRISVIVTVAGVSFLNTMGSGILVSALPTISRDIGLAQNLLLWPASVYALAAGCTLLVFGAVADVVGAKLIWVVGSFLYLAFTLAVGLSRTGIQMIIFRTIQGICISMCLPTSVSLITSTFARGSWRNTAFACNGMGQPLGYALGLVLGGVFTDTIGWRWGFYLSVIINAILSISAIFVLPSVYRPSKEGKKWTVRLVQDIDWIGAIVISAALGILLYVLATTTASYRNISDAADIALLVVAVVLLCFFPVWMHIQVRRGKPAIIPNALWKNRAFTSICIAVFLCWASFNAIQYFMTLVFQEVQHYSALLSSIRFLPQVIVGASVNIITAYLVSRVKVRTLGVISALVTMIAAPLMATMPINQTYWFAAFWAMLLSPVSPDVLFTVSNIVISDAYSADVQSLAGGVFNEVAQFGNSVGLAVTAAIAASVTEHSSGTNPTQTLMQGYRAAFWTIFAATSLVTVVLFFGLRGTGLIGGADEPATTDEAATEVEREKESENGDASVGVNESATVHEKSVVHSRPSSQPS